MKGSALRRAAKRDLNESEIVDAFKALGWSVQKMSARGCPDLLVAKGKRVALVEVKGAKGKLTPDQVKWRAQWTGPEPWIVRNVQEVQELNAFFARGQGATIPSVLVPQRPTVKK